MIPKFRRLLTIWKIKRIYRAYKRTAVRLDGIDGMAHAIVVNQKKRSGRAEI